jgi:hypothetical protein
MLCALLSVPLCAGVPDPVKSRFVVGDAVWREIPIRDDLQGQYEKCWQTAINAILESNFAIATMDKESGYVRTTELRRRHPQGRLGLQCAGQHQIHLHTITGVGPAGDGSKDPHPGIRPSRQD